MNGGRSLVIVVVVERPKKKTGDNEDTEAKR